MGVALPLVSLQSSCSRCKNQHPEGVDTKRHQCISRRHRYTCQFGNVTYASSVGVILSLSVVQTYRVSRRTVTCALVIGVATGVSLESSPMHLMANYLESDTHTPK